MTLRKRVVQTFSIDDIANMTINIEEEQSIDEWSNISIKTADDGWNLSEDFIVFDEDSSESGM